jgi:energy-coupling factor transport system ATP-binding protein
MAVIEVRDLTYTYPLSQRSALADIHLSVEAGELVGVVGSENAGKSTLCLALAGFLPHHFRGTIAGQVTVAGLDVTTADRRDLVRQVGIVLQNPFNQISGARYTVEEEIAFGLENLGVTRLEMRNRVEATMAQVGISALAKRSPLALSGGQQQRVALAAVLAMQPQVLILDEPTSQLDPAGCASVFALLTDLRAAGLALVMAEHRVDWLAETADQVVALAEGKVWRAGTPEAVFTAPDLEAQGIAAPRYTTTARAAQTRQLWPAGRPLPVTFTQTVAGFQEAHVPD